MRLHPLTSILSATLLGLLLTFASPGEVLLTYSWGEVLYQDSFDEPSNWVIEQMAGGTASIAKGTLEIDDAKGCTVWFKEKLTGPIVIEYEATMIQAGGPNDNTRDLNCFWMAVDPKYPTDLFRNASRSGQFRDYDSLRLYYVGYGGHRNTQTRFRRYNGLGERPLLPQHDLSRPEFMITPNQPHRIQIVAIGNRTQYIRDGEIIFDITDDQPYKQGWFGFRTVSNHMVVRNFKVTRLIPGPGIDADPTLMQLGAYPEGYSVHQVSTGKSPAMHAYMDICPESPDGTKITYFEFEDKVPGWGRVVIANRDGSDPKYISERIKGHDHDGARQQWIDNERVIYGIEDEESSLIYSLADKSSRKVKGQIGMVSEIHGFGLSHNNYPASKYKALDRKPAEVILMDTENASTQTLLNKQQMLAIHPRRSVIENPEYKGLGVFKHPKWSPDGSHFFWVYMLELKGTNTKIVKSALLSDREGKRITYVSEIGQHPMWYQEESLLSYVRRDGFDHFDNPSAQDIMEHPIDGSPGKPIVSEAIGIHGSPSPDGRYFTTDVFDWPEQGSHAVLLYHIESGDYRVLARMKPETGDRKNSMHPHPSWSRDGQRIYFNGTIEGTRRLCYIDLTRFEFRAIERR